MNRFRVNIPSLGTDTLWPLIVLAGFGFLASLVPLPPNDFWWHLKIGEIIFSEHYLPSTNMFGWALPANQPFIYGAWLGEFLYYFISWQLELNFTQQFNYCHIMVGRI
jgi:hypothetical protein